jgi:hypothetical protein
MDVSVIGNDALSICSGLLKHQLVSIPMCVARVLERTLGKNYVPGLNIGRQLRRAVVLDVPAWAASCLETLLHSSGCFDLAAPFGFQHATRLFGKALKPVGQGECVHANAAKRRVRIDWRTTHTVLNIRRMK